MYVELYNGDETVTVPVEQLVVYDSLDNPIAVVVQIETNRVVAVTAANKNFAQVLESIGLSHKLKVDHIDPKKLKPLN